MIQPPDPIARLAFLTQPTPGTFILNLQFDNQDARTEGGRRFERIQLEAAQVKLLAMDSTRMLAGLV